MLATAQSIAPLMLIIAAGTFGGLSGRLPASLRKNLTDFCYYFGMPALLVRTIANASAPSVDPRLIWISYLLPAATVWALATTFAHRNDKSGFAAAPALAMAAAYGNVLMLGIPLTLAQFGDRAATTVALVVLVHSPALFLAAAIHSEMVKRRLVRPAAGATLLTSEVSIGRGVLTALRDVVGDLVTNPIIVAIAAGLLLKASGTDLPQIIDKAASLVAQATLPLVLLAIGLGLSSFKLEGEPTLVALITSLKLLVMPALAWVLASRVLGIPDADAAVVTLMAGMPTGANAYIFACREGSAEHTVASAVALSTVLSIISIVLVLTAVGAS